MRAVEIVGIMAMSGILICAVVMWTMMIIDSWGNAKKKQEG